jgi:Calcineurin-like phosphoesterase
MAPDQHAGLAEAGRVAVIGDVGGHLEALTNELVRLGADPNGLALPADLTVIQVGDLVHRGPDSEGVIALVDRYLHERPRQWIQLVGNHEAQYLREPSFDWRERIDDRAVTALRGWWSSGRMRAATAVLAGDHGASESFLITHAGLTEGFWRRALDAPGSASLAASAINSFAGTHDDVLFSAGHMLGGGVANYSAGPIWAAAGTELVPSWSTAGAVMPFSQVHGHSSAVDWKRRASRCAVEVSVDEDAAHATVVLPGGRIIGVDPGHGARPRKLWRALVLQRAVVDASSPESGDAPTAG